MQKKGVRFWWRKAENRKNLINARAKRPSIPSAGRGFSLVPPMESSGENTTPGISGFDGLCHERYT